MKKYLLFPFLVLSIFLFAGCSDDNIDNGGDDGGDDGGDEKETLVISFEGELEGANSEFTTIDGSKEEGSYYFEAIFNDPTNATSFSHYYGDWGFGGGFTFTNKTDITTPGSANISAITGKGKSGSTYLTSKTDGFTPATITLLKPDLYVLKGAWVTNTTYAYLAMRDGEDGYNNDTKFEDGDYFTLTFIGYDNAEKEIDKVVITLADYRNGKTDIVNEWTWVDLSKIANAEVIKFEMFSTDANEFGFKTPTYFCLDGLTLEEK